ncbi:NAD-dependent epimerase/dehydratase family protein [Verrucomicrobiota bacterium]
MKVLFTGSSSFTGYWFIRELVAAGHEVTATFRRNPGLYEGVRGRRAEAVQALCECVFDCAFGEDRFMSVVGGGRGWDVMCHHGAEVGDYGNPDFDVAGALRGNTHNVRSVLAALCGKGCGRLVTTGSVFESDEGSGDGPLRAFSPYGLSKALTCHALRYYAGAAGLPLGKFVIPNPFGPFEEPRFTTHLVREWYKGVTPEVRTPLYVRDNIHVSLLARAYAGFVAEQGGLPPFARMSPSGYVQTQGEFAARFAAELRPRLGLACALSFAEQTDFPEPRVRVNSDRPDAPPRDWDEKEAWDELADFYRETYGQ